MGDYTCEDYDSDEYNEAYEEAWAGLRDGSVVCENSDGTFRCPYSPSRKKQDYKYSEIYQHAVGVSKGHRGPATAGKHCALSEYLAATLQPQAEPILHWQQDIPPRVDNEGEDKPVCPWMGILQNADIQTQSSDENIRIGPWATEIIVKLQAFNPESVKVLCDIRDHHAVAIIRFQYSMAGFKDAEAFDNSFHCMGRGRSNFEKDYPIGCGLHLYGWMASKKDVEGSNKLISNHLKSNGDLKSLPEFVKDLDGTSQQLAQRLKELVTKREDALEVAYRENWRLRNMLDNAMAEPENTFKRGKQNLVDCKGELETLHPAALLGAREHEEDKPIGSEGGTFLLTSIPATESDV